MPLLSLLIALWFAAFAFAQSAPTPSPPKSSAMEMQQAAMARQREAVRKQAEAVGTWMVPGKEIGIVHANSTEEAANPPRGDPPSGSKAACDPLAGDSLSTIIEGAAKAQSVQPTLLQAVIEQESGFHPCAVSPKGAKGMMQLMPDTASDLGVSNPFDPKENIEAGARYLRQLLDKYKGDLKQALGAYNAGPTAVDQAGGVPNIRETRDYVQAIMQKVGSISTDALPIPLAKPIVN